MAWNDRLLEAAYVSPSGVRIPFAYEDLLVTFDKKTSAFEFPRADGTYVQDLGHSGRRIPMKIFLWGSDYDLRSAEFADALRERGIGTLEHPTEGSVNVIPFGKIRRTDALKTEANQAVWEVVFWETKDLNFPEAQDDGEAQVVEAVEELSEALAEEFEETVDLTSTVKKTSFIAKIKRDIAKVKEFLKGVTDKVDSVRQTFSAIETSILRGIDQLVGKPLDLAFQVFRLVETPAKIVGDVKARLSAYSGLLRGILSGPDFSSRQSFKSSELVAISALGSAAETAATAEFQTAGEAISFAEQLLTDFDSFNVWREAAFDTLGLQDTGESYQKLRYAVSLAAGHVVEKSFDLAREREVVLDRNRTIVDLVFELKGSVDSELDEFINSNDLSGSEILELPAGKTVAYYV